MDDGEAPRVRQRRDAAAAVGRDGQREPVQGRPQPRHLEAAAGQLLLRLRALLDPGQELLGAGDHNGREDGAVEHVGYVLSRIGDSI
ncbi:hypothetical protein ANO14919_089320 [Xylariales sp. No.14919]|nr:hypothetical protein ANO14919_089320 [Xylariales sp. No.14919]